jgi:predicted metal-binding protein
VNVFVCTSCRKGGEGFAEALRHCLRAWAEVRDIDCMSGCSRDQTVAFRDQGKTAYLFGELTCADLPELENFARLYAASPDGIFADARVLGNLRTKALARIPDAGSVAAKASKDANPLDQDAPLRDNQS